MDKRPADELRPIPAGLVRFAARSLAAAHGLLLLAMIGLIALVTFPFARSVLGLGPTASPAAPGTHPLTMGDALAAAEAKHWMGPESTQLCLSCHKEFSPVMLQHGIDVEHPQNARLSSEAQRRAITEMGGRTGYGETMICMSCHDISKGHKRGDEMFLEPITGSRLCVRCHPDEAGVLNTAHDLRISAPDERNEMGQTAEQSGPCGACHGLHKFVLLPEPMPINPSGLCCNCHGEKKPGAGPMGLAFAHPTSIDQKDVPADLKLPLYPDPDAALKRVLACSTCHEPHESKHAHFLRMDPDALCAQCHDDHSIRQPGGHDLAKHPGLKNAKGRTLERVGRCGFCHAVHDAYGPAMWAATNTPPEDKGNMCAECHRAGGMASVKMPVSGLSHPASIDRNDLPAGLKLALHADPSDASKALLVCSTCHDLHQAKHGHFLRMEPEALCAQCHGDQRSAMLGAHDMTEHPDLKNGHGRTPDQTGRCGFCHAVHNANGPAMWIATNTRPKDDDGLCRECHRPDGMAGQDPPIIMSHPAVVEKTECPSDLALTVYPDARDESKVKLACLTCHDTHQMRRSHFLRSEADALCGECHKDLVACLAGAHDMTRHPKLENGRGRSAAQTGKCGFCHAVHNANGAMLWAATNTPPKNADDMCLQCHRAGGVANPVAVSDHPREAMRNVNPPDSPGFMPLFDDRGNASAEGEVSCRTCHLPHGRPMGPRPQAMDSNGKADTSTIASGTLLRPYVAPNLCSACHGFEGLYRFLYYHHPTKRCRSLLDSGVSAAPTAR